MRRVQHCLVCIVTFFGILSCLGAVPLADDEPTRTSFGSFEFAIPAGWSRVDPDRGKTVAMLLLNGTSWTNAEAMIKVDAGRPAKPTAKELAEALAGEDGKVSPDPVLIDGEKGFKVETPSTDMSRPRLAIVVFHDGKAYLIMGASRESGTELSATLDAITKTWKWKNAR